jgi:hypothetical protein
MRKVILVDIEVGKRDYDEMFIRQEVEGLFYQDPNEMSGYAGLKKLKGVSFLDLEEYQEMAEKAWMYEGLED